MVENYVTLTEQSSIGGKKGEMWIIKKLCKWF